MASVRPRLREIVRIEQRVMVSDGAGGTVPGDWDSANPLFVGFAQFRPINGSEEVLADKLTGVQPYEIVVRVCAFTDRITSDCRAVRQRSGETFNIISIQNQDERRRYYSMLAKKGVALG